MIAPVYSVATYRTIIESHVSFRNQCYNTGLILGLRPANERRCYFETFSATSLGVCRSKGLFWGPDSLVNTLRPRQNGRHFADDTFKRIFLNENVGISIKISLKFVPKGPIYNIPALIQIMAWRRPGDKPLSEPMMIILQAHICVTRPQWVKGALLTQIA